MKTITRNATIALFLLGMAVPAMAAVECTSEPQDKWMKPEEVQKLLTDQGYEVRSVKVEDTCMEAKGTKDGRKVEVYVDPVSGKIVKIKEK
jgi:hypothetical protein